MREIPSHDFQGAAVHTPPRSARRRFGRPGCLVAASGSGNLVGQWPTLRPSEGRVILHHQFPRPGMELSATHSRTAFSRSSISNDFRPRVCSNCRRRRSFSDCGAAALLPKRCLCSLLSFIPSALLQCVSNAVASTRLSKHFHCCCLPAPSATSHREADLHVVSCPGCLLLGTFIVPR
jgi:hypothetical protein